MALLDPCDQSTFPNPDFFEQHRLSTNTPPKYDYEYTQAYYITAMGLQETGEASLSPLSDLAFKSTPFEGGDPKGIAKTDRPWEVVLHQLFSAQGLFRPNPLNVRVYARSRIIILLEGTFWQFSTTMEPISTKLATGDRYFDVQKHGWDGTNVFTPPARGMPCRAISFFSDTPCPDRNNVRHGFSLNVEFTSRGSAGVLPITIDPDVENKGDDGPVLLSE